MKIYINNKSGIPIYDQIYSQIKNSIITGELQENYPLPSIRNLAKDLRISVITTKKSIRWIGKRGIYIYCSFKRMFCCTEKYRVNSWGKFKENRKIYWRNKKTGTFM